jgi:hypothetical protein
VIYKLIGKLVVKTTVFFVRQRYGTPIGFGAAALAIGAYLASREVEEG